MPRFNSPEDLKAHKAAMAKSERARKAAMTPEQRQREKEQRAEQASYRKSDRERNRIQKTEDKKHRDGKKRELAILNYMAKTNVLDHHHGRKDSLLEKIKSRIAIIKDRDQFTEYDPYGWNWGLSYPGLSLLGCRWSSGEFTDIYDVPLDGSYVFYVYDSGERGLGSKNRMTAKKVESATSVPYVNPGAIIPITAS
jgi:hypothetical protein